MASRSAHASLSDVLTREITAEDAAAAAELSNELGYAVSAEVMKQRIESFSRLPDHIVYVACLAGEVVGWIEVVETRHLAVGPRAEISGLVVSSAVRSRGIGRQLVARAEHWAVSRGMRHMVVSSRVTREAAHRFYRREGYELTKTSAAFAKQLDQPDQATG